MQGNGAAAEMGQRVKVRRAALGLSQIDLARKANISASYVSRLESGLAGERLDELIKIARALGWRLSQLVGESEDALLAELRQRLPSGTDVIVIFERLASALTTARDDDQTLILQTLEALAQRYAPPETGEGHQA